jgi:hypothetical protein
MNSIMAHAVARAMHSDRLHSVTTRTEEEMLDEARRSTPRRSWTTIVSFPRYHVPKAQPST